MNKFWLYTLTLVWFQQYTLLCFFFTSFLFFRLFIFIPDMLFFIHIWKIKTFCVVYVSVFHLLYRKVFIKPSKIIHIPSGYVSQDYLQVFFVVNLVSFKPQLYVGMRNWNKVLCGNFVFVKNRWAINIGKKPLHIY